MGRLLRENRPDTRFETFYGSIHIQTFTPAAMHSSSTDMVSRDGPRVCVGGPRGANTLVLIEDYLAFTQREITYEELCKKTLFNKALHELTQKSLQPEPQHKPSSEPQKGSLTFLLLTKVPRLLALMKPFFIALAANLALLAVVLTSTHDNKAELGQVHILVVAALSLTGTLATGYAAFRHATKETADGFRENNQT